MFLGVSNAFCWLSNISIFDKLLNFDQSNIDVMRETFLHNNWSFVPIFLEMYRVLMKWTHWSLFCFFFGGGGGAMMSPHDGGTHLECVEGRGEGSLPNYFVWEFILFIKTHFTGEHTLYISWRRTHPYIYISCFHDDIMKWKYVPRYWPFVWGIHRSPVNSPHKGQWRGALMFFFICAWPNGWINNQDTDDFRRHRAHYDVTVMWCRIVIQWSGQPYDLSAFNASLLSNFEFVKRVKLGGSVHYGRNGLKVGTLLYPDYHSLKLTIFCTQQQFKFMMSDHPWINFEMGRK